MGDNVTRRDAILTGGKIVAGAVAATVGIEAMGAAVRWAGILGDFEWGTAEAGDNKDFIGLAQKLTRDHPEIEKTMETAAKTGERPDTLVYEGPWKGQKASGEFVKVIRAEWDIKPLGGGRSTATITWFGLDEKGQECVLSRAGVQWTPKGGTPPSKENRRPSIPKRKGQQEA